MGIILPYTFNLCFFFSHLSLYHTNIFQHHEISLLAKPCSHNYQNMQKHSAVVGHRRLGRETEHFTNIFVQEGFLDLESGVPTYA